MPLWHPVICQYTLESWWGFAVVVTFHVERRSINEADKLSTTS